MVRRLCFCEFAFWVRIPGMPCTLAFRCRLIVICFQDTWCGVYPCWHVNFNITTLQLVSFSIDYHWACNQIGVADVGHSLSFSSVHETDVQCSQPGGKLSDKKRAAVFHPRSTYTFLNYLIICALCATLHRRADTHLQRFYVAGAHSSLSKFLVALQAFTI